ncbi:MAG: FAD-dependent oxidoreductase, partial [Bacteroidota bacterium]
KPKEIKGSEFQIPVDMVITSVGQGLDNTFLSGLPGVAVENGVVKVNAETLQTGNPKIFAGGDCISGGQEVVNAAAEGKKAARAINKALVGDNDQ